MAASPRPPSDSAPPQHFLLRRGEQLVAAAITLLALAALLASWWLQGGARGELLELDRAQPRPIEFVVDLNAADWTEFTMLPDVGETLAKRIVASREQEGPFLDLEDVQRVPGIGPKTFEKMRPYLLPLPADEAIVGETVELQEQGAS